MLICRVMKLYTLLAGVLPDDAVQWQIAPRLLLQVGATCNVQVLS